MMRTLVHGSPRRLAGAVVYATFLTVVHGGCAAPTVSLGPTAPSSESLAALVLEALADRDRERLEGLALNGTQFRDLVWPELPSSRPERGVPFDYAWRDLNQKSGNALSRLLHELGGQRLTLVGVSYAGDTTAYETFRVHRETLLTVLDEAGEERHLALYGSTLVRGGEYKIFSYVVD